MNFEIEKPIEVQYNNIPLKRNYRQDIIVEDLVIVELKAIDAIAPIHKAKLATYMILNEKPKGLLFNFNVLNITKEGMIPWVNDFYKILPD
jgi:GxxExxY protein